MMLAGHQVWTGKDDLAELEILSSYVGSLDGGLIKYEYICDEIPGLHRDQGMS